MYQENRRKSSSSRHLNYYGGALMILLGLGAIFEGMQYHVGSLQQMGPGFFPAAVGVVLAFIGVLIAVSEDQTGDLEVDSHSSHTMPDLRGGVCIVLGIVAFVVIGTLCGLLPATFAIVFISALGDRQNTVKSALLLASGMCVVSAVVFSWALQLQLPLFVWGT
jgi:hypothetical protein